METVPFSSERSSVSDLQQLRAAALLKLRVWLRLLKKLEETVKCVRGQEPVDPACNHGPDLLTRTPASHSGPDQVFDD